PLSARIARVGVFFPNARAVEPFRFSIVLRQGANTVRVQAEQPTRIDDPVDQRTDAVDFTVTLLSELEPDAADGATPVQLSDGARLLVTIPPNAADETMRGLRILRGESDEINPATYRGHRLIRPESNPVLTYRFEGQFQTTFSAEASASVPGQPPSLAVDGRFDFPSTWISSLVPLPVRWRVDLEREVALGEIVVHPFRADGLSYGPQQATVLVSRDNETFDAVVDVEGFSDGTTTIPIEGAPTARWVELEMTESKRPNDIRINEIEFFDAAGSRILAETTRLNIAFRSPIRLTLLVLNDDLARMGVASDTDLGVFFWNAQAREWQWTQSRGERTDDGILFRLDVNLLSPLAVFEMTPQPEPSERLFARWSFNPFSPNGDGIADTTRLMIQVRDDDEAGDLPEVTVELYDYRGMLVRTLADNAPIPSKTLTIEWDGVDRNGHHAPVGPYIYQVTLHRSGEQRRIAAYNGLIVLAR
ncbi:MAG: discoidin domain-containing protein, partial [Candidatus Poribacteria bacterium]|nr:discoidin domain-containing protein [Candidatus Poribacteria bacterium]